MSRRTTCASLRFGRLSALLLLACVAARPTAAQSAPRLGIDRGDGSSSDVVVRLDRGYAVVPVSVIEGLGWDVEELDGEISISAASEIRVAMRLGSPFFRWDGVVLQMADAPYRAGGETYVPLQFLSDFLPRRLPGLYEFDGERSILKAGDVSLLATGQVAVVAPERAGRGPEGAVPAAGAEPGASTSTAAAGAAAAPIGSSGGSFGNREEDVRNAGPSLYDGVRVVVIDPGHGGADPGAIGSGSLREKDVALGIGLRLAQYLEGRPELEVHLLRDDDTFVDVWERGQIATDLKGDRPGVFVSIHANSFPARREARGFETYFLSDARTEHERRVSAIENAPLTMNPDFADEEQLEELDFILRDLKNYDHAHWSRNLASLVQDELDDFHPGPNRGVKQGVLAVLTNALMPSVLIEVGYLSNPQEAPILGRDDFQEDSAEAIGDAVLAFFERYPPGERYRRLLGASVSRPVAASASRPVILTVILLGSGCTFHNVMHNAGELYARAESERRSGRDGAARIAYEDVARKTGTAVRERPDADWADDALLLYAKAQLRLGRIGDAAGALEEAVRRGPDPVRLAEIDVYRAVIDDATGNRIRAFERVNAALQSMVSAGRREQPDLRVPALREGALVEAHLLRGRLLLRQGRAEPAWWDLDRAVEIEPRVRPEAGVERLRWAVEHADRPAAHRSVDRLLADNGASVRVDTVSLLVGEARAVWGSSTAAAMLAAVDSSEWERPARGRLALQRARYLDEAGDTATAVEIVTDVSRGLGGSAAEARLLVADWRGERVDDLAEAYSLRALLLPAAGDPRVADRLSALDRLESFVAVGLEDPLGLFAAAELARDRLHAPRLARGLFLAYGDQAPSEPWAPKALLAALETSPEEGDRAWIRGRLEAYRDSPYVLAALGGSTAGFEDLEEELDVRLRELTRR